jgi:hypothetical protein
MQDVESHRAAARFFASHNLMQPRRADASWQWQ